MHKQIQQQLYIQIHEKDEEDSLAYISGFYTSKKKNIHRTISKLWETGWFKHRKNKNTHSKLKINYLKSVKAWTLS
jgi:hemerythrin